MLMSSSYLSCNGGKVPYSTFCNYRKTIKLITKLKKEKPRAQLRELKEVKDHQCKLKERKVGNSKLK